MPAFISVSSILAKSNGKLFFMCPACDAPHGINLEHIDQPRWSWNADAIKPTFNPSLLVSYNQLVDGKEVEHVCHSFIRDGRIQYLGDCTHSFANVTIDIPKWED